MASLLGMESLLGNCQRSKEGRSDTTVNNKEHTSENEVSQISSQDFGSSWASSFSGPDGSGGKQRRRRTRFVYLLFDRGTAQTLKILINFVVQPARSCRAGGCVCPESQAGQGREDRNCEACRFRGERGSGMVLFLILPEIGPST